MQQQQLDHDHHHTEQGIESRVQFYSSVTCLPACLPARPIVCLMHACFSSNSWSAGLHRHRPVVKVKQQYDEVLDDYEDEVGAAVFKYTLFEEVCDASVSLHTYIQFAALLGTDYGHPGSIPMSRVVLLACRICGCVHVQVHRSLGGCGFV